MFVLCTAEQIRCIFRVDFKCYRHTYSSFNWLNLKRFGLKAKSGLWELTKAD